MQNASSEVFRLAFFEVEAGEVEKCRWGFVASIKEITSI